MKLSQHQKLVVGLATLWMLVYPLLFLCVWFAMFGTVILTARARSEPPAALVSVMLCMMPFHFLTIAVSIALMVFYWAHIIKNTGMSDALRIIFGVAIFWFGYFAMPLYFIFFVWRAETPQWARPKQATPIPAQTDAPVAPNPESAL